MTSAPTCGSTCCPCGSRGTRHDRRPGIDPAGRRRREILKRLGRALKDDGHDVVLASNAREAMRGMADRQFDLVVVDNLMPGMSGLDMVREVMTSSSEADRHSSC